MHRFSSTDSNSQWTLLGETSLRALSASGEMASQPKNQ